MADDEFVQVGTWLLPEAYGDNYDHFTGTRMRTIPGRCFAVYAKASELRGTAHEWLIPVPTTEPGPEEPK